VASSLTPFGDLNPVLLDYIVALLPTSLSPFPIVFNRRQALNSCVVSISDNDFFRMGTFPRLIPHWQLASPFRSLDYSSLGPGVLFDPPPQKKVSDLSSSLFILEAIRLSARPGTAPYRELSDSVLIFVPSSFRRSLG